MIGFLNRLLAANFVRFPALLYSIVLMPSFALGYLVGRVRDPGPRYFILSAMIVVMIFYQHALREILGLLSPIFAPADLSDESFYRALAADLIIVATGALTFELSRVYGGHWTVRRLELPKVRVLTLAIFVSVIGVVGLTGVREGGAPMVTADFARSMEGATEEQRQYFREVIRSLGR